MLLFYSSLCVTFDFFFMSFLLKNLLDVKVRTNNSGNVWFSAEVRSSTDSPCWSKDLLTSSNRRDGAGLQSAPPGAYLKSRQVCSPYFIRAKERLLESA